ncbi:MAG: hypothetical protein HKN23_16005 [Verrucomicrobiales bacterium]|nr:hypothetical protein [Verrucomicrobiales bacterium]
MQKIRFEEAVKLIRARDQRFDQDAYLFLRDALDFTVQRIKSDEAEELRHVTGPQLLEGVRDHATKEFGPMAFTVLESWGVSCGEDIGSMVFQLIEVGAFGKSAEDSPEDFAGVLDLEEELTAPFRPKATAGEGDDLEFPDRQNQPATKPKA